MRKTNTVILAIFTISALAWCGSASALNPQPEPPMERNKNIQLHQTPGEPPDPCVTARNMAMDKRLPERERTRQLNAAELACANQGHRLNPQPLPPG